MTNTMNNLQFIIAVLRDLIFGIIITWAAVSSVFAQGGRPAARQNIIDTNSKPMVFAAGVVSTPYDEWATSFTPDGNTVYFSQGAIYWTICFSKKVDGKWTRPRVSNISGKWKDTDPFVSPDGKRIFFVSNRPLHGEPQDKAQKNFHLWYADRISDDEWSAPHHIDAPVNLAGVNNYAPSVSRSGSLFFCSRGREGHAGMGSYCAAWLGDHYDKPKLLLLNENADTQDPFIAPDESYIIFASANELYVSFREGDGWSAGQKLGRQVNNGDAISSPYVSPDGKMLYYSTNRVQGFYKRDPRGHALNYDELETEMKSIFNSSGNILMIPVNMTNLAN